jgi:Tol biopolymer transport system component
MNGPRSSWRAGGSLSALIVAGVVTALMAMPQKNDQAEVLLQSAIHKEMVDGELEQAIDLYKKIVASYSNNRPLAAKALLQIGQCYEKLGKDEARKAYERLVREYADQAEQVAQARTRLAAMAQTPPAPGGMMTRRVWAGPEVDTMGAPSPDGRLLTFVDWNTGDLAIRDLTTGKSRRLTDVGPWFQSTEFAEGSRVSPDGKHIVYALDRYPSVPSVELRLIGADGSGARVLYSNPELDYVEPRDWSPDGGNILVLFTRYDHVNQIALVSAASGSVEILKNLDWRKPLMMAFSPDGRYIAYDFPPQEDSENRDIFLLASDGSRVAPLVQHPANDFLLGWAPGNEGVLFASDRTGVFDAWMIRAEDGRPAGPARLVKQGVGRMIPMGFTRDGSYYYGVQSGSNEIYLATLDPGTGTVLEPPASVARRFMGSNFTPVFSPDGRSLAYLSRRSPVPTKQSPLTLAIRSLEDGAEKEFKLNDIFRADLTSWSSNGRWILLSARDRKGGQGLYMADVTSGAVTSIVRSEPGEFRFQPTWSPDNKTIYFIHVQSQLKLHNLAVRDLESGRETELVRAQRPSFVRHFALSPDGRQLAFTWEADGQKKGCLKVIPATGGEPRELFCTDESLIFYQTVRWTPDGRYILLGQKGHSVDLAHHQTVELWRIPAEGGQPQKLGLAMDLLQFLAVHPDGGRVAFQAGQYAAEVWVMENFLPPAEGSK